MLPPASPNPGRGVGRGGRIRGVPRSLRTRTSCGFQVTPKRASLGRCPGASGGNIWVGQGASRPVGFPPPSPLANVTVPWICGVETD